MLTSFPGSSSSPFLGGSLLNLPNNPIHTTAPLKDPYLMTALPFTRSSASPVCSAIDGRSLTQPKPCLVSGIETIQCVRNVSSSLIPGFEMKEISDITEVLSKPIKTQRAKSAINYSRNFGGMFSCKYKYPQETVLGFLQWKLDFLSGREGCHFQWPMKSRKRKWLKYLEMHWSSIPWAKGNPLPSRDILRHWMLNFRDLNKAGLKDKISAAEEGNLLSDDGAAEEPLALCHYGGEDGSGLSPTLQTPLPEMVLAETRASDVYITGAAEINAGDDDLPCDPLQMTVQHPTFSGSSPSSTVQRTMETDGSIAVQANFVVEGELLHEGKDDDGLDFGVTRNISQIQMSLPSVADVGGSMVGTMPMTSTNHLPSMTLAAGADVFLHDQVSVATISGTTETEEEILGSAVMQLVTGTSHSNAVGFTGAIPNESKDLSQMDEVKRKVDAAFRELTLQRGAPSTSGEGVSGTLQPRSVSKIFDSIGFHPGAVFLDIGSGPGHIVLSAGLGGASFAYGIELPCNASIYGVNFIKAARKLECKNVGE